MMRNAVYATVVAVGVSVLTASADPVAFYMFDEGDPGETVETVLNSVGEGGWSGTAQAFGTGGRKPMYSDDVPGRYLFDDPACTHLVTNGYRSVDFPVIDASSANIGGRISFDSLATKLSSMESYTIEYFVKCANPVNWRSMSFCNVGEEVKFCIEGHGCLAVQNITRQNQPGNLGTGASVTLSNLWHHLAFTWTNNTMTIYVDYIQGGTCALTNTPQEVSRNFLLASGRSDSEYCPAKFAAFRVSEGVLDRSQFLRALDNTRQEIVRLDFRGAHGEALPARIPNAAGGLVWVDSDAAKRPVWSSDAPAKYIMDGFTNENVVAADTGSVRFSGGQNLRLNELGTLLSPLDEYTVEMFFALDKDETWKTVYGQGFAANLKLCVDAWLNMTLQNQSLNKSQSLGSQSGYTFGAEGWHHAAFVMRRNPESPDNGILNLYVDYRKANDTTPLPLKQTLLNGIYSSYLGAGYSGGNEYLSGRIALVRVTMRALERDELLYMTDCPETMYGRTDTIFHWRFEEGADGLPMTNVVSSADSSVFFRGYGNRSSSAPIPTCVSGQIPERKSRIAHVAGHDECLTNRYCVRMQGYDGEAYTGEWDGSFLHARANSREFMNPKSYTMECFVRTDPGMQKYIGMIMSRGDGQNAYEWKATVQMNGKAWLEGYCTVEGASQAWPAMTEVASANRTVNDGKWHHVAVAYDDDLRRVELYVDYKLVLYANLPGPLPHTPDYHFYLGRGSNCRGFNGWLDEVRLSKAVLEPSRFLKMCSGDGFYLILR